MNAVQLIFDDWQDRQNRGLTIASPTWGRTEECILALDGVCRTLVMLSDPHDESRYLLIAGQWDGRCMVNATNDNLEFWSLVDDSMSSQKRLLFVGGQTGDYDQQKCVPIGWALAAARSWLGSGERDPSLRWLRDK